MEKRPPRACAQCGAQVASRARTGRPRLYCETHCRRLKEYARRKWDRAQGWIRAAEMNAAWEALTPAEREAHRQRAFELRRHAGSRP